MTPEEAVAKVDFGKATAAKRGRNPKFPYVPIIKHAPAWEGAIERTEQIRLRAFATREEAVEYAVKVIRSRRALLLRKLETPHFRALREHHGVTG